MKSKIMFFSVLFVMVSGCDEIFLKDLGKKEITILAPPASYTTTTGEIQFWWDVLDGADGYDLQVVTPSFGNVAYIALDTTVTSNKLLFSFQPGHYQWRVRAVNDISESTWAIDDFTIEQDTTQESAR